MFDEFFQKAHELRAGDVPFASVVVVRAEKPTSGKPGDRAIVTLDGRMFGWVGGSCAQPTVIEEAARAMADGVPRLVRLSPNPGTRTVPEGIEEVPMTCFSGGTLDLFIEPHRPRPQLLIVGTLPVARALAHLGKAMSYRVTVVDPTGGDAPDHADAVLRDLSEIETRATPLTFAVVATHGEYDEPALKAILSTDVPYVGLVASRSRGEAVLGHLRQDDVDEEALARVRYPAGLDIGARRGDEIAVSIIAEIVQVRHGSGDLVWPTAERADDAEEAAAGGALGESVAAAQTTGAPKAAKAVEATEDPGTAVDPICKMSVAIEGAMHTHEHEGRTYYFCCGGCRSRFAEDPESYLVAG